MSGVNEVAEHCELLDVKPKSLEERSPPRSPKREKVNDQEVDYYPESPSCVRRLRFNQTTDKSDTSSQKNFPCTLDWAGSTVELSPDGDDDVDGLRRIMHRVMEKNGRENVALKRLPEKSRRYMRDVINTLIELKWKYMLTLFFGSFFFSWIFFGVLCFIVGYYHGDFLFDAITGERLGHGQDPCIYGVTNFVSMLLYSITTQTTIGGGQYASEECPETIFLYIMQMMCGAAIEGSMVSVVYAKILRPDRLWTKLKFSDKAVICYRDGKLCLLFRVCDPREQQSIDSKIRVYMIVDKHTREGELIKAHTELKLEGNGEQMIVWPDIVCHVIDETSPLYRFGTAKQLNAAKFELYVTIVGTSPTTAQMTEAKTSYVPREIYWGQRFVNIIEYDAPQERYIVDYENFNTTISVDMPFKATEESVGTVE